MQQVSKIGECTANAKRSAAAIAWVSILLGALSGMVLGLWSFEGPVRTPDWIGPYDSLPRRFLRLARIALFALGMLYLFVARQVTEAPVGPEIARIALFMMGLGTVAMPAVLIGAALWEPIKFLSAIPAFAITTAVFIAAVSALRQTEGAWR